MTPITIGSTRHQTPAEAQAQGGGDAPEAEPMTGDLLPCPFCGKANQDRWPCDWLDGSGANVIRCAWCHGAAPMNTWNRRTAPPSAPVGVEDIIEAFDEITGLCRHLRQGGPAPEDLHGLSGALDDAADTAPRGDAA